MDKANEDPQFDPTVAAKGEGVVDLLRYYRSRIEEFERERELFLQRFSEVEVEHEDLHRLKWELQVREDEIVELQKALSDSNVYLFDEREQVVQLQAENDQLKIQELEDRRRIQHLLALTQPVSQEVTFFRDCRPETMVRFPQGADESGALVQQQQQRPSDTSPRDSAAHQSKAQQSTKPLTRSSLRVRNDMSRVQQTQDSSVHIHTGGPDASTTRQSTNQSNSLRSTSSNSPSNKAARVLRTVYLPSERADALLLTVQSLQQQLADLQRVHAEKADAWRRDRDEREAAFRRKAEADSAHITTLEEQLKMQQDKTKHAMRDYLALRHSSQVTSRELREQLATTISMLRSKDQQLEYTKSTAADHIDGVRSASEREAAEFRRAVAEQHRQRDDDLKLLREQYVELQQSYEVKVSTLQSQLQSSKKKHRQSERRRALELEGFTTDIAMLRKAVRQMEAQWAVVQSMAADEMEAGLEQPFFDGPAGVPATPGHDNMREFHPTRMASQPPLVVGHTRMAAVPSQFAGALHARAQEISRKLDEAKEGADVEFSHEPMEMESFEAQPQDTESETVSAEQPVRRQPRQARAPAPAPAPRRRSQPPVVTPRAARRPVVTTTASTSAARPQSRRGARGSGGASAGRRGLAVGRSDRSKGGSRAEQSPMGRQIAPPRIPEIITPAKAHRAAQHARAQPNTGAAGTVGRGKRVGGKSLKPRKASRRVRRGTGQKSTTKDTEEYADDSVRDGMAWEELQGQSDAGGEERPLTATGGPREERAAQRVEAGLGGGQRQREEEQGGAGDSALAGFQETLSGLQQRLHSLAQEAGL